MNIINIPGFTAEASFRSTARLSSAGAQHAYNDTHSDQRVIPVLPIRGGTNADCMNDCLDRCIESGKDPEQCEVSCNRFCHPVGPPFQCTNRDNSINHTLCLGGVGAWQAVCSADCGLLGGIPGIGPALAGACAAGCLALANKMRGRLPAGCNLRLGPSDAVSTEESIG